MLGIAPTGRALALKASFWPACGLPDVRRARQPVPRLVRRSL